MHNILQKLKKILFKLFNNNSAGIYMLVFALAIAVATFIENDFGTSAAQKLIFKAKWFELLLLLFSITLITNVIRYRFIQQKKWALLIFHLAIVIIIVGAGITRYFSYEGMMHIREGESSNIVYTSNTYLNFEANYKGESYQFHEPVLFASIGKNRFHQSYLIGDETVEIKLKKVLPNPMTSLEHNDQGLAIIKIVFGSSGGRQEYFLQQGEQKWINGLLFNFSNDKLNTAFNIIYNNDSIFFESNKSYIQTIMADRSRDTLEANQQHILRLRSMYDNGEQQFVFGAFESKGKVVVKAGNIKVDRSGTLGLLLDVGLGNDHFERYIYGGEGRTGSPQIFQNKDIALSISYGSKQISLPFSLYLNDFIMDRYPGTNSPASYASEVSLHDPLSHFQEDFRIYMNHILKYKGYRFFQSSYDRDEAGTYLSVNHDAFGTLVTYIGYALLTLGMLMIFVSKKTRFRSLSENIKKLRAKTSLIALLLTSSLLFSSTTIKAQTRLEASLQIVSAEHAGHFSRIVVQDFSGRMKPMHTLDRELMRKISGHETFRKFSADQVILSMYADRSAWFGIPIIKMGNHPDIAKLLGVKGKKAAYDDFFDQEGHYKLSDAISKADNMNPAERGIFEKQLIKVDERLNIVDMIFSGSFFKIIPLENDPNNTWVSERQQHQQNQPAQDRSVADAFFNSYREALYQSMHSNDYTYPDQIIKELKSYQQKAGAAVMLSDTRINAEILLNRSKIFNRLALFDFLLGMVFISLLFFSVFRPKVKIKKLHLVLLVLVIIGFTLHTLGLAFRWYVSGRAPWSNGYESMIYIAWTSTLAGLLFTRKSLGAMAATLVLAGTVLMIAMLSYLDPEITPLVPVLKSYWLTIHVGLEAGSYGFLMLGAIIGLINLLLFGILTKNNKKRIIRIVKEMSYISEMTLIGGLVMLSIGTYLGGVWANESWGRYWGWDAKETWALVSILVYAFILHMRLIPKLRGLFAYNFATLFGLSSIIMTYYGVNYYLSGLHSYATGDPVPIPSWVYISIACISLISLFAFIKKKKFKIS